MCSVRGRAPAGTEAAAKGKCVEGAEDFRQRLNQTAEQQALTREGIHLHSMKLIH